MPADDRSGASPSDAEAPPRDASGTGAASGPEAERARPDRSIPSTHLERVIRRASDLQFRAGDSAGEGALAEAELIRIGQEVGLEPRYVRRALAEVHAESLFPGASRDARLPARLWGRGLLRASRVVPGESAAVTADLERHLRERELLKPVRRRHGRSLWEPASGLLDAMKRAMDVGGHGYELAKARSLELAVEGLEPGWSLVVLTADFRNRRAEAALAWHLAAVGVAGPAALALIATAGPELWVLAAAVLAGATGLVGATWTTAARFRRRRDRVQLVLEGLLDRLEMREPLASPGRGA